MNAAYQVEISLQSSSSFVRTLFERMKQVGNLWSWSYGSWIYNYLCNQCLSPL